MHSWEELMQNVHGRVGVEKQQVETGKYNFRKGGISFSDQKISNYEKFL
jgi:hypothetical protein